MASRRNITGKNGNISRTKNSTVPKDGTSRKEETKNPSANQEVPNNSTKTSLRSSIVTGQVAKNSAVRNDPDLSIKIPLILSARVSKIKHFPEPAKKDVEKLFQNVKQLEDIDQNANLDISDEESLDGDFPPTSLGNNNSTVSNIDVGSRSNERKRKAPQQETPLRKNRKTSSVKSDITPKSTIKRVTSSLTKSNGKTAISTKNQLLKDSLQNPAKRTTATLAKLSGKTESSTETKVTKAVPRTTVKRTTKIIAKSSSKTERSAEIKVTKNVPQKRTTVTLAKSSTKAESSTKIKDVPKTTVKRTTAPRKSSGKTESFTKIKLTKDAPKATVNRTASSIAKSSGKTASSIRNRVTKGASKTTVNRTASNIAKSSEKTTSSIRNRLPKDASKTTVKRINPSLASSSTRTSNSQVATEKTRSNASLSEKITSSNSKLKVSDKVIKQSSRLSSLMTLNGPNSKVHLKIASQSIKGKTTGASPKTKKIVTKRSTKPKTKKVPTKKPQNRKSKQPKRKTKPRRRSTTKVQSKKKIGKRSRSRSKQNTRKKKSAKLKTARKVSKNTDLSGEESGHYPRTRAASLKEANQDNTPNAETDTKISVEPNNSQMPDSPPQGQNMQAEVFEEVMDTTQDLSKNTENDSLELNVDANTQREMNPELPPQPMDQSSMPTFSETGDELAGEKSDNLSNQPFHSTVNIDSTEEDVAMDSDLPISSPAPDPIPLTSPTSETLQNIPSTNGSNEGMQQIKTRSIFTQESQNQPIAQVFADDLADREFRHHVPNTPLILNNNDEQNIQYVQTAFILLPSVLPRWVMHIYYTYFS